MPKGANQKFKLYRLAQIMQENTDDSHYMTMPEIMVELKKYGITAERKSIYSDLKDLEQMGKAVSGAEGNARHSSCLGQFGKVLFVHISKNKS